MGKKRTTRKQKGGSFGKYSWENVKKKLKKEREKRKKQKGGWGGGIPSFVVNAKGWNHGIMGRKRKRSPLQLAMQSAAKKRKRIRNQKGGFSENGVGCCIM